jgi:hypothetical protein
MRGAPHTAHAVPNPRQGRSGHRLRTTPRAEIIALRIRAKGREWIRGCENHANLLREHSVRDELRRCWQTTCGPAVAHVTRTSLVLFSLSWLKAYAPFSYGK